MGQSFPATGGVPIFPQELIDAVIDHLYDDLDTLQQCSLVCRAWEPSITLHLFSSFSWPARSTYWRPYHHHRLDSEEYECLRHAATFSDYEALLFSSTRLRAAICHLILAGGQIPTAQILLTNLTLREGIPYPFLYALLKLLLSLQTLQIYDLEMAGEALQINPISNVTREDEAEVLLLRFGHPSHPSHAINLPASLESPYLL